jgi:hypothetical protein
VTKHFYVHPDGHDDGPGTLDQPFATIQRAQWEVRSQTAEMHEDLVVNLHGGMHHLSETWLLSASRSDSGNHGASVVYQSHGYGTEHAEQPVISGARPVAGWVLHDGDTGVWRADVGDAIVRQLVVDGRLAHRAASSVPEALTLTEEGYVLGADVAADWVDATDMELVYTGINPWSEARIGVASIERDGDSVVLTMRQPAFGRARSLYVSTMPDGGEWSGGFPGAEAGAEDSAAATPVMPTASLERPTLIENGSSFLREPGTFVFERTAPGAHSVYYLPLPQEDMSRVEVVAPFLETLLMAEGSPEEPLHDVMFRGLTFADATWLRAGNDEGFLHYHGLQHYDGGPLSLVTWAEGETVDGTVTVPSIPVAMPANLVFRGARNVVLEQNTFVRLGATAVSVVDSTDVSVVGNTIAEVSGAAVMVERGEAIRIEGNWVHHVGWEYRGSPGMHLSGVRKALVLGNTISDVPHAGIVMYGGDRAQSSVVRRNLVERSMGVLADGGGLYFSGPQGTAAETVTVVAENVISDCLTSYNVGLYTDYGAAWMVIERNIVQRTDVPATVYVGPPLHGVSFRQNWWDGEPLGGDQPPATVELTANQVLATDRFDALIEEDPEARAVLRSAGRNSGSST